MEDSTLIILVGSVFALVILYVIYTRNKKEHFLPQEHAGCTVAPRFDHYFNTQSIDRNQPMVIGKDNSGSYYTTEAVPTGASFNYDTITVSGEGEDAKPSISERDTSEGGAVHPNEGGYPPHCTTCGGDYTSVAPNRYRYYQPEQGFLGENILSGFPFYKAY